MPHFHSHSHKTGFLLLGCTQKERIIQMRSFLPAKREALILRQL